ncbi:hypothetical protein GTN30_03105 [Macrococcoides canis]|uniref:NERD domain-containing protein n=1 Tax=Macrococcoides canis TaxID=1855823 RepID=A0AAE6X145_9STAP|nr:nuclease-related domain-containing protein [Macrococcus canis]QIH77645.1 hypothetical protein GTN30_03105 [Macrococcus canis]
MVKKPKNLILEEALHRRLSHYVFSDDYYYTSIGYEGELLFAQRFPIQNHHIELYNINLHTGAHKFEIDRLIITGESIYAFDVKNYKNKYKSHGKTWNTKLTEISSPEVKFNTIDIAMKQLLFSLNIPHKYATFFAFINRQFYIDIPFKGLITYNEISTIFNKIHSEKPVTDKEKLIRNYFIDAHRPLSFHDKRPNFNIKHVKKGLKCINCNSSNIDMRYSKKTCKCRDCLTKYSKNEMVLNSLLDLDIIIGRPFSIKEAHKWIGTDFRNLTNNVLKDHFNIDGGGNYFFPYP